MSARKPRVYEQGGSLFVIGTSEIREALKHVDFAPGTHRWTGTDAGNYARRLGQWRAVSTYSPPKDARPGVCFRGPIRSTEA